MAAPVLDTHGDEPWDPLADPDVDLAAIGAAPEVESLLDPIEPMESPTTSPLAEPNESEHKVAEPEEPAGIRSAPIPPPPSGPPPLQALRSNSDPTLPGPPSFAPPSPQAEDADRIASHILAFDDGQEVAVVRGVYVGRHPTKNGLPENYSSATIRGEHVSRVHWELRIENNEALIRNLSSNSGIEVEVRGERIAVPDAGLTIPSGSTVHFADRWATYEMG